MRTLSFLFILLTTSSVYAGLTPLTDNVLLAFEKCKSLSADLEKGLLKEAPSAAFDVRCEKSAEKKDELSCSFYDQGSSKALSKETFTGGSDLGEATLTDKNGRKIKFLIGKGFASYESGPELKACVGIFIYEKDALKRKAGN